MKSKIHDGKLSVLRLIQTQIETLVLIGNDKLTDTEFEYLNYLISVKKKLINNF